MTLLANSWPDAITRQKTNVLPCPVALRTCAVSFVGIWGIRDEAEVQAESLYEAALL
jgi:hypothetical protein